MKPLLPCLGWTVIDCLLRVLPVLFSLVSDVFLCRCCGTIHMRPSKVYFLLVFYPPSGTVCGGRDKEV
jgi:hypothetical protein